MSRQAPFGIEATQQTQFTTISMDAYKSQTEKGAASHQQVQDEYMKNKTKAAKPAEWFAMDNDKPTPHQAVEAYTSTQKASFHEFQGNPLDKQAGPAKKIEPLRRDFNILTGEAYAK